MLQGTDTGGGLGYVIQTSVGCNLYIYNYLGKQSGQFWNLHFTFEL